MCRACAHTWKNEPAQRCSRNQDSAVDTFNDLYSKNAPSGSIAAGDDCGRLNIMSSKGLRLDYSTVELALLAHYKTNSLIISRIIRLELVVDYQPDYQLNYQPHYQPGSTEVPAW